MPHLRYIPLCTPVPGGGCDRHGLACPTPGKRPVDPDWVHKGQPERPEGNAGVLCGPETGLLVIDVDVAQAADEYAGWGLPETFTVKTGRGGVGRHYYFRWPQGLERVPNRLDGVEIKGPGRQVVAWDSLHQSGGRYEKLGGAFAELPEAFVTRLRNAAPQHDRTVVQTATAGALDLLEDWLAEFPDAEQQHDGDWAMLCPAHDDHDPSLVVTASEDRLLVHCRADCAIHDICAAVDWAPADLWVRPAAPTFDLGEISWRRVERGVLPAECHWEQDDAGDWVLVSVGQSEVSPGRLKRRWNGAELAVAPLPPIQTLPLLGQSGYIGKGLSNLVAAFPKVGKTTLMSAFLRETLASGLRVLYFSEEGPDLWKQRLTGPPASWAGLDLVCAMGSPVGVLLDILRESPAEVVVVDTLRSVIGWDDENDNARVAQAVTPWIVGCREGQKTLVGLHHATKAGGQFGRGISGGHALFGAFDQAVEVDRYGADTQRRVRTFGRIGAVDDMLYEMHAGQLRKVTGPLPDQAEADAETIAKKLEAQQAVVVPGRESLNEALGLDLSKHRVEAALKYMTDARWTEGREGKPSKWLGRPNTY